MFGKDLEHCDVSGLVGEVFLMDFGNSLTNFIKVVDLKVDIKYIEQYVEMRNKYTDLLLTSSVNVEDTLLWIKKHNVEIRGIVNQEILEGVAILYIDKEGEIAFFVKKQNKGIGTKLLSIIEDVAKKIRLPFIWAWVLRDNEIAKHVFEKCGFLKESDEIRMKEGIIYHGVRYKKKLKL